MGISDHSACLRPGSNKDSILLYFSWHRSKRRRYRGSCRGSRELLARGASTEERDPTRAMDVPFGMRAGIVTALAGVSYADDPSGTVRTAGTASLMRLRMTSGSGAWEGCQVNSALGVAMVIVRR